MPFEKITSSQNPLIKKIVSLRERTAREESGLTIIDGRREIGMALKSAAALEHLIVCPDFLKGEEQDLFPELGRRTIKTTHVTPALFEKISFGNRREGVLALCKIPHKTFADIRLSPSALIVVVEKIEKPGNLGAILRTCDAAGVDGLIICDGATDIYNPNVIRSSLGAVFSVAVVPGSNSAALDFLKKGHLKILGAFPDGPKIYTQTDLRAAAAVVLGSEDQGLSAFWQDRCDEKIRIPMKGRVNSLNVSMTAAILIYEAIRQRASK